MQSGIENLNDALLNLVHQQTQETQAKSAFTTPQENHFYQFWANEAMFQISQNKSGKWH